MPSYKDVLPYQQAGFKVFPVNTLRNGKCSCAGNATCGVKNIAKHPMTPNGVNAVRDVDYGIEKVRMWWEQFPDANIGIALGTTGGGLYCQDIDNSAISAKLLELFESEAAPEGFVVATSGREGGGCHIYFRSEVDKSTENLSTDTGEKIGELRGTGSYVIAPPSLHASGRQYAFFYGSLLDSEMPTVEEPRTTVIGLLRKVGIEVRNQKQKLSAVIEGLGPVTPIDCPFDTQTNTDLTLILKGTYITRDTSQTLCDLSRWLWQHAARVGYPITDAEVAGIVKKVDAANYQKFTGRGDDRWYWDKALKAKAWLESIGGEDATRSRRYTYSDEEGLFFITSTGRMVRLANFKPTIVEDQRIIGNEGQIVESAYVMRCELPKETAEITLTAKDLSSEHALKTEFSKQLPRQYLMEPEGWARIWLAANELAEYIAPERQFSATGWVETDQGWGFVLPGAEGALTAEGLDNSTTHYGFSGNTPSSWNLFGLGVRPADTLDQYASAVGAFSDLLDMLPPQVLLPMIDLVLGGPLTSLGIGTSPPLVHIYGKTGQLKTSSSLAIMSLLGQFTGDRDITESWTSTANALQHSLHVLRDLPLLIDDYKPAHIKSADVAKLVQNYADRTSRSRLSSDASRRESLVPYALLLSTGEDRWEQEQSVQARTFSLPFPRLDEGGPEMQDRKEKLKQVQDHVLRGNLALIGGTYIRFLARLGQKKLEELIAVMRKEERAKLNFPIHARVLDTIASLKVIERILHAFIKSEFPALVDRFQKLRDENWKFQCEWLVDEAREAEELGPARRLLTDILGGMTSGKLKLEHRHTGVPYGSLFAPDVIGLYDDAGVYLLDSITWKWFTQSMLRSGERPPFSWKAVVRDATENMKAESGKQLAERNSIKSLRIPHEYANLVGSYNLQMPEIDNG